MAIYPMQHIEGNLVYADIGSHSFKQHQQSMSIIFDLAESHVDYAKLNHVMLVQNDNIATSYQEMLSHNIDGMYIILLTM